MRLTFLSAILFYLSFPNRLLMHGFWPCIWIFAIPLLLALHDQPLAKRLGLGIFFSACAYGLMAQGLIKISPAGFLAFVLGFSIQSVFFAAFFKSTQWPWVNAVYAALLWAVSEVVRNQILGGFSFYISHAQAFCPMMLKLYGTIGCLGMSVVIIAVNGLIYAAFVYKEQRRNLILTAAFIVLGVIGAGIVRSNDPLRPMHPLRVGVIQANISPWEKADPDLFDRNATLHLELTEQSYVKDHPDLVIWPETAFPDDLLQSTQWRPLIFGQAAHMNADILMGMAPIMDGKEYNSALLINTKGQVGGLYHKQALVPFAETSPLEKWGIHWGRGYHFSSGDKPGILTLSRSGISFGVVICSESAHPAMVRRLRREGAQFLVEISNDGWFSDQASYMLHAQAAIMRAVENHWWVIRAANTGFSFAVDPNGVIHSDGNLKLGHEGVGIFDIMVSNP